MLRDKSGINKLIEIKDECLDEIELIALDDPREPIMLVNDHVLAIRNGVHNYRSHYVLPMVIGAWCFLFFLLIDLSPARVVVENARYQIDRYERGNGSVYSEDRYLFYKNMVGENGDASTTDYLRAIYLYGGEELKTSKQQLLMIILIMLILSVALTYWYLRFR
ncbi:hypothetical protein ABS858_23905, partial [Vibrio neptunius]|uniref:hypothetical protein n=1 Tax=Vibrio neptunius TaxID=170651 RepID=UPI00331623DA